jgi:DNA-binding GntR family transcriptional regulator
MLLRNCSAPLSAQEIASRTGVSYATVRVLLHRLATRSLVTSPGRNSYTASPADKPLTCGNAKTVTRAEG